MASTATIFVPFSPPNVGIDEIEAVVAVLESGWLTTGPRVRQFEAEFAAYTGAPHAVAVNSCTAAQHLSLLASGVGKGHEVITTPLTFCATANVIAHTVHGPCSPTSIPRPESDPADAGRDHRRHARAAGGLRRRPADLEAFERLAHATA
jgi:hypothetical protein